MYYDKGPRDRLFADIVGVEGLLYVQSAISRERAESLTCPLADEMEKTLDRIVLSDRVKDSEKMLLALFYMILERNARFGFDVKTTFCVI